MNKLEETLVKYAKLDRMLRIYESLTMMGDYINSENDLESLKRFKQVLEEVIVVVEARQDLLKFKEKASMN